MVDVDRAGIVRTAKALGGEGTNVLLLKPAGGHDLESLDAALPAGESEGPANGGWFPGPKGPMLLVEGLDEQVDPWIDRLVAGLNAAGVAGTLTGAGTVVEPLWARRLHEPRDLHGLIGFRPQPGIGRWDGWMGGADAVRLAVGAGMGWLTEHEARVMAVADVRAQFWVEPSAATRIMVSDTARIGQSLSSSYHQQRHEVRIAGLSRPAAATLSSRAEGLAWVDTVDELRSALIATPLEHVSIAMVSHRSRDALLATNTPGEYFHRKAFDWHPERWDEFTLDPCGIQILTNRHLAAAEDLSGWRTTRLDDDHVLVEARDLAPWFAAPRPSFETVAPEVIDQARQDFGGMVLTPERAEALNLTTKPPFGS